MEEKSYDDSFYINPLEVEFVQKQFKESFEYFERKNYPNESDTLMCSIHESFDENGHNCVACNLETSSKLIINYLKNYNQFQTAVSTFPLFIHTLYLMVERMEEYFKIMELPTDVREKKFKIFSLIKRWANFNKHPKAFMFVHHPNFIYDGFNLYDHDLKIDDEFVKLYYSGTKNNRRLYDLLTNKEKVLVVFPNPLYLIEEFCEAQQHFVKLISDNTVFQEVLNEKATKYYEYLDETEE